MIFEISSAQHRVYSDSLASIRFAVRFKHHITLYTFQNVISSSSSPSRVTLSEVSSFQLSLCCGMAVSPFSSQIAAVQIDGTVVVDGKTSLSSDIPESGSLGIIRSLQLPFIPSVVVSHQLREGVKLHPSTLTRDPVIHQIPYHSVDFGSSANVVMTACGHSIYAGDIRMKEGMGWLFDVDETPSLAHKRERRHLDKERARTKKIQRREAMIQKRKELRERRALKRSGENSSEEEEMEEDSDEASSEREDEAKHRRTRQPNYKMPGKGNIVGLWNGFTPLTLHKPSCSSFQHQQYSEDYRSVETTKHPIPPSFISALKFHPDRSTHLFALSTPHELQVFDDRYLKPHSILGDGNRVARFSFHADGTFDAPQADLPRPMLLWEHGTGLVDEPPLKLLDWIAPEAKHSADLEEAQPRLFGIVGGSPQAQKMMFFRIQQNQVIAHFAKLASSADEEQSQSNSCVHRPQLVPTRPRTDIRTHADDFSKLTKPGEVAEGRSLASMRVSRLSKLSAITTKMQTLSISPTLTNTSQPSRQIINSFLTPSSQTNHHFPPSPMPPFRLPFSQTNIILEDHIANRRAMQTQSEPVRTNRFMDTLLMIPHPSHQNRNSYFFPSEGPKLTSPHPIHFSSRTPLRSYTDQHISHNVSTLCGISVLNVDPQTAIFFHLSGLGEVTGQKIGIVDDERHVNAHWASLPTWMFERADFQRKYGSDPPKRDDASLAPVPLTKKEQTIPPFSVSPHRHPHTAVSSTLPLSSTYTTLSVFSHLLTANNVIPSSLIPTLKNHVDFWSSKNLLLPELSPPFMLPAQYVTFLASSVLKKVPKRHFDQQNIILSSSLPPSLALSRPLLSAVFPPVQFDSALSGVDLVLQISRSQTALVKFSSKTRPDSRRYFQFSAVSTQPLPNQVVNPSPVLPWIPPPVSTPTIQRNDPTTHDQLSPNPVSLDVLYNAAISCSLPIHEDSILSWRYQQPRALEQLLQAVKPKRVKPSIEHDDTEDADQDPTSHIVPPRRYAQPLNSYTGCRTMNLVLPLAWPTKEVELHILVPNPNETAQKSQMIASSFLYPYSPLVDACSFLTTSFRISYHDSKRQSEVAIKEKTDARLARRQKRREERKAHIQAERAKHKAALHELRRKRLFAETEQQGSGSDGSDSERTDEEAADSQDVQDSLLLSQLTQFITRTTDPIPPKRTRHRHDQARIHPNPSSSENEGLNDFDVEGMSFDDSMTEQQIPEAAEPVSRSSQTPGALEVQVNRTAQLLTHPQNPLHAQGLSDELLTQLLSTWTLFSWNVMAGKREDINLWIKPPNAAGNADALSQTGDGQRSLLEPLAQTLIRVYISSPIDPPAVSLSTTDADVLTLARSSTDFTIMFPFFSTDPQKPPNHRRSFMTLSQQQKVASIQNALDAPFLARPFLFSSFTFLNPDLPPLFQPQISASPFEQQPRRSMSPSLYSASRPPSQPARSSSQRSETQEDALDDFLNSLF
ncbi:hypothetical protein BLNAU_7890 [Blattamonas nauphoetae]|uniref:Uncharacterized protein n=1 Tax=Blattamonas nauphoetae TaxID=2049346 RepID=A0ABQ9Y009_9EUKA|nr:hypothetical protein BLNAU_7890 [Blattamonas nauphoetae]